MATEEMKDKTVTETTAKPQDDGTLMVVPEKPEGVLSTYSGASALPFSKEIADILAADFDPEMVEVKPHNGVVFLPGTFYRQRLNQAFGPGGWAMIPRGPRQMKDGKMFESAALWTAAGFKP